jgi:two-component system response regulator BaeR
MESILIVDDDANLCKALSEELTEVGYDTQYLTGGEGVLDYVKNNQVDLLLLDLKKMDLICYMILILKM